MGPDEKVPPFSVRIIICIRKFKFTDKSGHVWTYYPDWLHPDEEHAQIDRNIEAMIHLRNHYSPIYDEAGIPTNENITRGFWAVKSSFSDVHYEMLCSIAARLTSNRVLEVSLEFDYGS